MAEYKDNRSEQEIFDESLDMMNDFSRKTVDDIDESLLMKMQKGPVKKVWDQVMMLWKTVNDPKTEKIAKALGIGALIYLVTPIDAIPDIVPMLGLTDDVAVVAYAISQLAKYKKLK